MERYQYFRGNVIFVKCPSKDITKVIAKGTYLNRRSRLTKENGVNMIECSYARIVT